MRDLSSPTSGGSERASLEGPSYLLFWWLFADRTAEHFHEGRIECGAGLRFDHLERLFKGYGHGAGSVGGEFVERLGKRDEASQVGDPFLFKGERIASAVPAFMMEGNNLHGFRREADGPPDARTEIRTMLRRGAVMVQHGTAVVADQVQIM